MRVKQTENAAEIIWITVKKSNQIHQLLCVPFFLKGMILSYTIHQHTNTHETAKASEIYTHVHDDTDAPTHHTNAVATAAETKSRLNCVRRL